MAALERESAAAAATGKELEAQRAAAAAAAEAAFQKAAGLERKARARGSAGEARLPSEDLCTMGDKHCF